jgi:hypothetical protein
MALLSLFYGSPTVKASTNAPNLIDRIRLVAQTLGRAQVKGALPQFDVQKSTGKVSTNAPNLTDMPIFRVSASGLCSTGRLARLYGRLPESSIPAQLSNVFTGDEHRIVTPMSIPMVLGDTYIDVISWTGMLGGGHLMELTDINGKILARAVSNGANDSNYAQVAVHRLAVGGYKVVSLDSGVLMVTVGQLARNIYG